MMPRSSDKSRVLESIDAVGAAVVVVDVVGERFRVAAVNRRAAREWGLAGTEGTDLAELLAAPHARGQLEHYRRCVAERAPVEFEAEFEAASHTTPRGPRWSATSLIPILEGSGRVVRILVTLVDVTSRKRAEADAARLAEELRQLRKMGALGRLTGGVAHDFNNILTVIQGYGEVLLHLFDEDDARAVPARQILEASERAVALTRQLLAFSGKRPLRIQALDVNEPVARLRRLLERLIGEDVRLEVELAAGLGAVQADPAQLEQVLMNLAINAREAMPSGGRLRIATRERELARGSDLPRELDPGSYVCISVEDTGPGVPLEDHERIFEPFFTTKGEGGTGLGLSTAHAIARELGGALRLDSAIGRGSTFEVLLPRVAAPAAALPQRGEEASGPATPASGVILVVEDEAALRSLMRHALEQVGYTVLEAEDGAQALEIAAERADSLDLVISDVVMPGMGGHDLEHRLRDLCPRIKLLLTSGYPEHAHREPAEPGEPRTLPKPFGAADLEREVREALGQGPPAFSGVLPP